MSHALGMDTCRCLTELEKYHIERSLNNEINKIEKDIKKEQKEHVKITKKGKLFLKTIKELKVIKDRVQHTPDCTERYGE